MTNEMPNEIYIQLGENRIGTETCIRKWSETPFENGTKYTRADIAQTVNQELLNALKYTVDWFQQAMKGNIMDCPDAGLVIRKSKQAIARAEQRDTLYD